MASSSNSISISQPSFPIFDGEGYEHWSIMMTTMFRSQDLWELLEKGFSEQDEQSRVKENKKKDAKALYLIQQAVQRTLFSHIITTTLTKHAQTILQTEFQGASTMVEMKVQTLKQEFETSMKGSQCRSMSLARIMEAVNQTQAYDRK